MRIAAWVVALAFLLAGCGDDTPDYQSIWTTTTTTTTSAAPGAAAKPVPLSAYLESVGVTGDPIAPEKITDLTVDLPRPAGWQAYSNVNLSPGTRVIAKGDTYPTAMLMVFKLTGNFDIAETLKHADADAQLSQNFTKLNGSADNFRGFPSSMIEGTYDLNGRRMQSYNRIIIATGTPPKPAPGQQPAPGQRYLIQLTITSYADEAQKQGKDIEGIISGFKVAAK
ncbi:MAG: LpqN/LpqT family lipoprotein [Mycolicibacterium cosmeticum]|nr:LpqN/LpqT family lipoprotein [Mycolicibacterium cosmeticum]